MAQSRIKTKWQLTIFFETVALLLACYTLGSLWEYADTLKATNAWMLKVGIVACEFSVFVWVWFHIWRRWWVTRLVTLGLATAMGIFLTTHSSAVSKYVAAKKEAGAQTEDLAKGISQITGAASQGIVKEAGQTADRQRQQRRPNTARATQKDANDAAVKVGAENARVLADARLKLEQQAQNSTFLSADYLNGKMQAVVFIVLLIGIAITALTFEAGKAEEDDDDDGIPNYADADSPYYDAKRAADYWHKRGQNAPHELTQPSLSPKPTMPPSPTFAPGFASAVQPQAQQPPSRWRRLLRRYTGSAQRPNSDARQ